MTPEHKAALLRLIEEDPEVRAAAAKAAKETDAPAPEPVFNGPAWLAKTAAHPSAGPHTKARLEGPKTP